MAPRHQFEALSGFFADYVALERTSATGKVTTQQGFGLVDRSYESDTGAEAKLWSRFERFVNYLNETATERVSYKVLFLTRHGMGFHNLFEAKVGTKAWDDHWAKLEGDGTITWADAQLIPEGIQQARDLAAMWADGITSLGVPLPATLYTSPLMRCLDTTRLVFADVFTGQSVPASLPSPVGAHIFRPIVKEFLRERMTDHTCDRRSSRSVIAAHCPDYLIEDGFSEEDVLWRGDRWETQEEHDARKQIVLDEIFATDPSAFISLTVHSYAISSILRVAKAPLFRLREGSTIAVLVKATQVAE